MRLSPSETLDPNVHRSFPTAFNCIDTGCLLNNKMTKCTILMKNCEEIEELHWNAGPHTTVELRSVPSTYIAES